MPAVAIGKAMDTYNAVFEPYFNFIGWVGAVFVPVSHNIQQVPQLGGYLPFTYTNVLVGFAKLTCPCLYIGIHAFMQLGVVFFPGTSGTVGTVGVQRLFVWCVGLDSSLLPQWSFSGMRIAMCCMRWHTPHKKYDS